MLSPALSERVDGLIDELIMDGGLEAASLASILLASLDSLSGDYLGSLSKSVWSASTELKAKYALDRAYQAEACDARRAAVRRPRTRAMRRSG